MRNGGERGGDEEWWRKRIGRKIEGERWKERDEQNGEGRHKQGRRVTWSAGWSSAVEAGEGTRGGAGLAGEGTRGVLDWRGRDGRRRKFKGRRPDVEARAGRKRREPRERGRELQANKGGTVRSSGNEQCVCGAF